MSHLIDKPSGMERVLRARVVLESGSELSFALSSVKILKMPVATNGCFGAGAGACSAKAGVSRLADFFLEPLYE